MYHTPLHAAVVLRLGSCALRDHTGSVNMNRRLIITLIHPKHGLPPNAQVLEPPSPSIVTDARKCDVQGDPPFAECPLCISGKAARCTVPHMHDGHRCVGRASDAYRAGPPDTDSTRAYGQEVQHPRAGRITPQALLGVHTSLQAGGEFWYRSSLH
jgi:hypothetical protein